MIRKRGDSERELWPVKDVLHSVSWRGYAGSPKLRPIASHSYTGKILRLSTCCGLDVMLHNHLTFGLLTSGLRAMEGTNRVTHSLKCDMCPKGQPPGRIEHSSGET